MDTNKNVLQDMNGMKKTKTNQEQCFVMIMLLANRFQSKLDSYTGEITLKQWLLLCMLINIEKESVSINELAAVVGYSRQNVTKIINILVGKGYLKLQSSSSDRRAYEVNVTEKAKQFFFEFKDLGQKLLNQLFYDIPDEKLAVTGSTMDSILMNIEKM